MLIVEDTRIKWRINGRVLEKYGLENIGHKTPSPAMWGFGMYFIQELLVLFGGSINIRGRSHIPPITTPL